MLHPWVSGQDLRTLDGGRRLTLGQHQEHQFISGFRSEFFLFVTEYMKFYLFITSRFVFFQNRTSEASPEATP